jgi:hypothetical protein
LAGGDDAQPVRIVPHIAIAALTPGMNGVCAIHSARRAA